MLFCSIGESEPKLVGISLNGRFRNPLRDAGRDFVYGLIAQSLVPECETDPRPTGAEHQAFTSKLVEVIGRVDEVLCHVVIVEQKQNEWLGRSNQPGNVNGSQRAKSGRAASVQTASRRQVAKACLSFRLARRSGTRLLF